MIIVIEIYFIKPKVIIVDWYNNKSIKKGKLKGMRPVQCRTHSF